MRLTTLAIFIDANIVIYAAGRSHPYRQPCREILLLAAENPGAFTTDAEVLQEMLHRYLALRIWPDGAEHVRDFSELLAGRVADMKVEDVLLASEFAMHYSALSARDLVHVAVMKRLGVMRIVSADHGFDGIPDIERLDPARLEEWRAAL